MAEDVEAVAEAAQDKVECAGALAEVGAVVPVEVFDKAILGGGEVAQSLVGIFSSDRVVKAAAEHILGRKSQRYESALRSELVAVVKVLFDSIDDAKFRAKLAELGLLDE